MELEASVGGREGVKVVSPGFLNSHQTMLSYSTDGYMLEFTEALCQKRSGF